jgi:molybdopterin converting factor small subunit
LIRVKVRLYGELRDLLDGQGSGDLMSLPEGSTLEALNESLGISLDDVVVMLVNGVAVNGSSILHEGERVDIFPPLAGG